MQQKRQYSIKKTLKSGIFDYILITHKQAPNPGHHSISKFKVILYFLTIPKDILRQTSYMTHILANIQTNSDTGDSPAVVTIWINFNHSEFILCQQDWKHTIVFWCPILIVLSVFVYVS